MKRNKARFGPLHWIPEGPVSIGRLLLDGLSLLDEAVIFGDGAQAHQKRSDYVTQVRLDWKYYSRRMKFLDEVDRAQATLCRMDWKDFFEELRYSAVTSFHLAKFEKPNEKKALVQWAFTALSGMGEENDGAKTLLVEPLELLKFSYEGLHPERLPDGTRTQDTVLRLILIGLTRGGVGSKKICQFCYRLATPPRIFCSVHGQQRGTSGTSSQKARNYFVGAKIRAQDHWSGKSAIPKAYNSSWSMRQVFATRIAEHLWFTSPSEEEERRIFDAVKDALNCSPRVSIILGDITGMSNSRLEALLRAKLDPLETSLIAWPEKIGFAEEWLVAEALAAPGKRGFSPKTEQRILQAEELARSGKNIVEIASFLGVSRTAIVKWCSRGRAPELAMLLASHHLLMVDSRQGL